MMRRPRDQRRTRRLDSTRTMRSRASRTCRRRCEKQRSCRPKAAGRPARCCCRRSSRAAR